MENIFFNPSSNILTFKRHYFKGHFVRIECISFKTCSWTNIARVLALMIEMLGGLKHGQYSTYTKLTQPGVQIVTIQKIEFEQKFPIMLLLEKNPCM